MRRTREGVRDGMAVADARAERARAHAKHVGTHAGSREQQPHDDPLWLPIIVEEVGEVARALNDREPLGRLRAEVIQAAAMCLAYADALEEAMHAEVRTPARVTAPGTICGHREMLASHPGGTDYGPPCGLALNPQGRHKGDHRNGDRTWRQE